MSFYVYESDTDRKVRVHAGHCSYCNEGKGRQLIQQLNKSRWHGPYLTLAEAQTFAKSLKRKSTRNCSTCLS